MTELSAAQRQPIQRGQVWRIEKTVKSLDLLAGGLALVVSNDPYNLNPAYPWCVVASVVSVIVEVPTHMLFAAEDRRNMAVLAPESGVRAERLGCVPKTWLMECVGAISSATMHRVERALCQALALS